MSKINQLRF